MKIIFYSYSGVHSAVLAGAVYLGKLSSQEAVPLLFQDLPFYGHPDRGSKIRYLGDDERGNQVYTLGVGGEPALIARGIEDFLRIALVSSADLKLINTADGLNNWTKWGEKLATKGLQHAGNFLATQGLKRNLPSLIKKVSPKQEDPWY